MTRVMTRALLGVALLAGAGLAQDPGEPDSREAPRPLKLGQEVSATIQPLGDVDTWAVEVPGAGVLWTELTEVCKGEVAPQVTVEDEAGTVLMALAPAPGVAGRGPASLPGPGKYRVVVRDGAKDVGEWGAGHQLDNRDSAFPYGLKVTFEAAVPTGEPDDTREKARILPLDTWVEGSIFPLKDQDRFRVELPEPGWLQLSLQGVDPPLGPALEIEDAEGKPLRSASRPAGHDLLDTVAVPQAGTWYLVVRDGPQGTGEWNAGHQWDNQARVEPYRLRARLRARPDPGEAADAGEPPPGRGFGPDGRGEGRIWPVGDRDVFGLDVPEPGIGRIRIELSGMDPPVASRLVVTGPGGSVIHEHAVGEGAGIAVDLAVAAAGRYRIQVGDGPRGEGEWGAGHQVDNAANDGVYRLVAGFTPLVDPGDPDSAASPRVVRPGERMVHRLFPQGDQDFFRIEVPGPGVLELAARAPGDGVALLVEFLAADGAQVLASYEAPENEVLHITRGAAGAGPVLVRIRDGAKGPGEWGAGHQLDNRFSEAEIAWELRFAPAGPYRLEAGKPLDMVWPAIGAHPEIGVGGLPAGLAVVVGRDGYVDPRPTITRPGAAAPEEGLEAGPWIRVLAVGPAAPGDKLVLADGPKGAGEWGADHLKENRAGGLPAAALFLPEPTAALAAGATTGTTAVLGVGQGLEAELVPGGEGHGYQVAAAPGEDVLVLLDGWAAGGPAPRVLVEKADRSGYDEVPRGDAQAVVAFRRLSPAAGPRLRLLHPRGSGEPIRYRIRAVRLGGVEPGPAECGAAAPLRLAAGRGEARVSLAGAGDARAFELVLEKSSRLLAVLGPRGVAGGNGEVAGLELDGAPWAAGTSGDGFALHARQPLVDAGKHCLRVVGKDAVPFPLTLRVVAEPLESDPDERAVTPGSSSKVSLDRPGAVARRVVEAVDPGVLAVNLTGVSRRLDPRIVAEVFPLAADSGSPSTFTADGTMGVAEGGSEALAVPVAVPSRVRLALRDPRPDGPAEPKAVELGLVFRASPDAFEPDGAPGTEVPLTEAGMERSLFPPGDEDWFRVAVDQPAEMSVVMETPSALAPRIEVFTPADRQKPFATLAGLHGAGRGHPEGDRVFFPVPGQYLLRVFDPEKAHGAIEPYRIAMKLRSPGPDAEPDGWGSPIWLEPGKPVAAVLHPEGQEDFFAFRVGAKGRVGLSARPLDSMQDLALALRRRPALGVFETAVLHLVGRAPAEYGNQRTWQGLEGVRVDRKDWDPATPGTEPLCGAVLADYSAVILDHIGSPAEFGLDRPEAAAKLAAWVEAGGRLVVVAASPFPAANSPRRGARLVGESPTQWDAGGWARERIHDGVVMAGGSPGGWSSAGGSPAPHVFTWDLGEARSLTRAVFHTVGQSADRIPKEAAVEVADSADGPWRAVASCALDPAKTMTAIDFPAVLARFARVNLAANGGHAETQLGEIELLGSEELGGLFQGAAWPMHSVRGPLATEPSAEAFAPGLAAADLPSSRVLALPEGSPFKVVHRAESGDPVVAVRSLGKGLVWLDSQRATDTSPERMAHYLAWRHPLTIGSWNATLGPAGFEESVVLDLEADDYVLRVGGTGSLRPYEVKADFPGGGPPPAARLLGCNPPDGTVGLPAKASFMLSFDAPVDPAAYGGKIRLEGRSGPLPVKLEGVGGGRSIRVVPGAPLVADGRLELRIETGPGEVRNLSFRTFEGRVGKTALSLATNPPAPLRSGPVAVRLEATGRLAATPELWLVPARGGRIPVPLVVDGRGFAGRVVLEPGLAQGPASFEVKAAGTDGEPIERLAAGAATLLDFEAPGAPQGLAATSLPAGAIRLAWKSAPAGDVSTYVVLGRAAGRAEVELATVPGSRTEAVLTPPGPGRWSLRILARDAAGNDSPAAAPVEAVADSEPPAAVPEAPVLNPMKDGTVQVDLGAWPAGVELADVVRGEGERVGRVVAPERRFTERIGDGTWSYRIRYVDAAGNAGPAGPPSRVVLDTRPPTMTLKVPGTAVQDRLGPGLHLLAYQLDESTVAAPALFLGARPLAVTATGPTTGTVELEVGAGDADGPLVVTGTAKDAAGNVGLAVRLERAMAVDTGPPRVTLTAAGGIASVRGDLDLVAAVDEPLGRTLTLAARLADGQVVPIPLTGADPLRGPFQGRLVLPAGAPDGTIRFQAEATDLVGHAGARWVAGERVELDRTPPGAVAGLVARTRSPTELELVWEPIAEAGVRVRVHRGKDRELKPDAANRVAEADGAGRVVLPVAAGVTEWARLVVADAAGNESAPSAPIALRPDTEPPGPPGAVRATRGRGLEVRVAWSEPAGERPERYQVVLVAAGKREVLGEPATTFLDHRPGDGRWVYAVASLDAAGNASALVEAPALVLDTSVPALRASWSPAPLGMVTREGRAAALSPGGALGLVLEAAEPLPAPPELSVELPGSPTRVGLPVEGSGTRFTAKLETGGAEGFAVLAARFTDRSGNRFDGEVPGGRLWLAPRAPAPPGLLTARAGPGGTVALEWEAPPGAPSGAALSYRVEAREAGAEFAPLAKDLGERSFIHRPASDGPRRYRVVALDEAGRASAPTAPAAAVADRVPPGVPGGLVDEAVDGKLRLAWGPEPGARYTVTRVDAEGRETELARDLDVAGLLESPPGPGPFTYRVVARDEAGNASGPAERRLDLRGEVPAATLAFDPPLPLRGPARLTLTFGTPLAKSPVLEAHYPDGAVEVLRPEASGPGVYLAAFQPRDFFLEGEIRFALRAEGPRGLVGRSLAPGDRFMLDARPPRGRVRLEAPGVLVPGREARAHLDMDEPVDGVPRLAVRWPGGTPEVLELTPEGAGANVFSFGLTPPATTPDGAALLALDARDRALNEGHEVEPARLYVDRLPPFAPVRVEARARAGGRVELSWEPAPRGPTGPAEPLAGYRVLRAGPGESTTGPATIAERTASPRLLDAPAQDGPVTYTVVAIDRAGWESEPSAPGTTTVDRTPPARPAPPRVTADDAGLAVAWDPGAAGLRYRLLVREPGKAEPRTLADASAEASARLEPVESGRYAFRLVELDGLGQPSEPSAAAEVDFVRDVPAGLVEVPGEGVLGIGSQVLGLKVDRAVPGLPTLALVTSEGARIPAEVAKDGDGYRVKLEVPAAAASGPARFEFEAVGAKGGKGHALIAGETCQLDTRPPTARIEFPGAGRRRDKTVLGPGMQRFVLDADEPLAGAPEAKIEIQGAGEGGAPLSFELPLIAEGPSRYAGTLEVAADGAERDAVFVVAMKDGAGNLGREIPRGRHALLDAAPPRVVRELRAMSMPGGEVRLEWTLPWHPVEGEDRGLRRFRIWRTAGDPGGAPDGDPWREVEGALGIKDQPGRSGRFSYALAAIDLAGNLGPPSGWATVEVDADPPEPPGNVRARLAENGAVELAWDAPAGKVLFYNAWLGSAPQETTAGLTSLGRAIPFTRVYGTPGINGRLWLCVTAIDDAMNESRPSAFVSLDYDRVAPIASFFLEPDIWLRDGAWPIRLETSLPLAKPPKVTIHGEDGSASPLAFEGAGAAWTSHVVITPELPEGTYGLRFAGETAAGTTGIEVARGPLFHLDRTPPLPPSKLRAHADPKAAEGAVGIAWNTPANPADGAPVEVPYFYDVYRTRRPITSVEGLAPVFTQVVTVKNVDDYAFSELPPDDGTWYYTLVSRDLAGNPSAPAPSLAAVSSAKAPRASIRLYTAFSGPVPVGRVCPGEVRVELTTSRALRAVPSLEYRVSTEAKAASYVEGATPVALVGSGTRFTGTFSVPRIGRGDEREAMFTFKGVSEEGIEGAVIREGERFFVDTADPVADITVPRIRRYLPDPSTMKPVITPLMKGDWPIEVHLDEEVVGPPELSYRVGDGDWIPVPLQGAGRDFQGLVRVGGDHPEGLAELRMLGRDLAGNLGGILADVKQSFRDDEGFPTPRVLEAYATTGGRFAIDRTPPAAPLGLEIEVKSLGVAVLTAKPPPGEPMARWNLYRDLAPIRSVEGRTPIQKGVFRSVFADAAPRDGTWYYAVTAEDLAGNESPPSECVSMFVDSIKPELKITAVPMGDEFFLMLPEDTPPGSLTAELRFPGGETRTVQLGGSSGELAVRPDFRGTGRSAILLPEKLEVFDGTVQVIVHSPDPKGNVVETQVSIPPVRRIPPETGGTVTSSDQRISIDIPPDLEVRVSKGPGEERKITGFDGLFLVSYQKLPTEDTPASERTPYSPAPLPLSYELVAAPIKVEINQPPEEQMMMKAAASQADLSGLTELMKLPMLRMKLPETTSEAASEPEYLKKRLRVLKWIPEDRERAKPGKWEPIAPETVVLDPASKEIIFPADRVTTYVVVSERTPPSVRDLAPAPGARILEDRPVLGATLVDKGTGVAVGAANRIDLRLDGARLPLTEAQIDAADPTEVKVRFPLETALAPGEHTVTVRGEDVVGNVATRQWRFVLDNVPPTVTPVRPAASGTRVAVARPVMAFELADAGSRLDPSMIVGSLDGRALPSGMLRFDPPTGLAVLRFMEPLAAGSHQLRLEVTDQGGRRAESILGFERLGTGGFLGGGKAETPSPSGSAGPGGQPGPGSPTPAGGGSGAGPLVAVLLLAGGAGLAWSRRRRVPPGGAGPGPAG